MDKLIGYVGFGTCALVLILIAVPLGTLCGGLAAGAIGLFFGDTILGIAGQLGLHGVTMFQLGLFLGFVGSFLRTTTSDISKK